jgi:SAM-dependent methyltransferase
LVVKDEHFVPEAGLDLAPYLDRQDVGGVHHLIRYLWALECLSDEGGDEGNPGSGPKGDPVTVLDVACGSGYGAHEIARRFPTSRVVGADYDAPAVEEAARTFALPNLEFRVGDLMRWDETIGPGSFRCVVTFDTIEHVPHRELMLQNLVDHLDDDGLVLLSTPCGRDENNLTPDWHAHRIEYSSRSLYDFLRRYFRVVTRPEDPEFPHRDVFDRLRGTGVNYWLKMNPVLCRGPVRIDNPYPGPNPAPRR